MNKWKLYKLLKRNDELKDERHPMFERNKFMKWLAWFMFIYYAALLLMMGVTLPMGMSDVHTGLAGYHVLDGGFYILLIVDFWTRFVLQDTPANMAKPYTLLPISRKFLMQMYLTRAGLTWGNLFWGFFLVPFACISIAPHLGWGCALGWLLGWWLMLVANGYMYLLTRAACMKHMLWFLVPLALHAALVCVCFLPETNPLHMPFIHYMNGFVHWDPRSFALVIAIIALMYWINYKFQGGMVYDEVAKKEEVEVKDTVNMTWLNRYGALGEYMKMEIKLRLRNKQVKIQFFVGLGLMCMLSLIMYFTSAYDGSFMKSFVILYNYIVLGMMTLVGIMGYEGNYIDGLMSRRESIYALLRAKYYFNSMLLLIPVMILTPLMISGKLSVWMNLGYLFFTVGVLYPMIFQLAVYNRDTLPLNNKLTGKQGNMVQNITSIAILFLPIGVEKLAVLALGDPWGYILLAAIGMAGVATHQMWLRNIYTRFMARRYHNMEGFRASRNS